MNHKTKYYCIILLFVLIGCWITGCEETQVKIDQSGSIYVNMMLKESREQKTHSSNIVSIEISVSGIEEVIVIPISDLESGELVEETIENIPTGISTIKIELKDQSGVVIYSQNKEVLIEAGKIAQPSFDNFSPLNMGLILDTPIGQEIWNPETLQTILWEGSHPSEPVKIELLKEQISTTLISTTPNDGAFEWIIPNGIEESESYILKISYKNYPYIENSSGNYFTIGSSSIELETPNGSEAWEIDSTYSLTWSGKNIGQSVMINLFKNDTLFDIIADAAPEVGAYLWTISSDYDNSDRYRISISSNTVLNVIDYSDEYFTIYKNIIAVNTFGKRGYYGIPTSDGGFIGCGTTYSEGSWYYDIYVIKASDELTEEWSVEINAGGRDEAFCIQETIDGGYVVCGVADSYGIADVLVVKLDALGEEIWNRTYGDAEYETGATIEQTNDGGFIIGGRGYSYVDSLSKMLLIKINSQGDEEWSKTYGDTVNTYGNSAIQTLDGGYAIAGTIAKPYGEGYYSFYLIKTDLNGEVEWSNIYGGTAMDQAYSLSQTEDGGYIITGVTYSFGSAYSSMWLVKLDASGNEEWNELYGGNGQDYAYFVSQTSDGGYVVAGKSNDRWNGDYSAYLVKTNSSGGEEWSKKWDWTTSAGSVQQVAGDRYFICGNATATDSTLGGLFMILTDPNGEIVQYR